MAFRNVYSAAYIHLDLLSFQSMRAFFCEITPFELRKSLRLSQLPPPILPPAPSFFHSPTLMRAMKFHIRRNNSKVDSIQAGHIVVVHLLFK